MMENNYNFKSQICTSREQSERLLALGLKKETADMIHQSIGATPFNAWDKQEIEDGLFPAWSLHRLFEIMPKRIIFGRETFERTLKPTSISYSPLNWPKEFARWADKTMIDKTTQWLFENVYDYLNPEDQERVESFRKAMEE